MKWTIYKIPFKPRHGDVRFVRRFLFKPVTFPTSIPGVYERRWLCSVWVLEKYIGQYTNEWQQDTQFSSDEYAAVRLDCLSVSHRHVSAVMSSPSMLQDRESSYPTIGVDWSSPKNHGRLSQLIKKMIEGYPPTSSTP